MYWAFSWKTRAVMSQQVSTFSANSTYVNFGIHKLVYTMLKKSNLLQGHTVPHPHCKVYSRSIAQYSLMWRMRFASLLSGTLNNGLTFQTISGFNICRPSLPSVTMKRSVNSSPSLRDWTSIICVTTLYHSKRMTQGGTEMWLPGGWWCFRKLIPQPC